jgi:hypothetical protein
VPDSGVAANQQPAVVDQSDKAEKPERACQHACSRQPGLVGHRAGEVDLVVVTGDHDVVALTMQCCGDRGESVGGPAPCHGRRTKMDDHQAGAVGMAV